MLMISYLLGAIPKKIDTVVQLLHSMFTFKDLGMLNFFLGIEVLSVHDGLLLSQTKYIKDLLYKAKMRDAKHLPTPMISRQQFSAINIILFYDPTLN